MEEFGGFDHEFFYHHALFVGYNVTNTIYNTIKAGKRVWGLAPKKSFTNALPTTLESAFRKVIQGCQKNPLVEGLYGSIYLNLSG